MKILEVINSLRVIGGAETFSVSLIRELSKKEEVFVVVLYNQNNPFLLDKVLSSVGENRLFVLNKKTAFDLNVSIKIKRIIKQYSIDVIHTENDALISTFFGILGISKKRRPPIAHTIHLPPNDECPNRFKKLIYKEIFRSKSAKPVAITQASARDVEALYQVDARVIQNGIDTLRFKPSIAFCDRKLSSVTLARMTPVKNYPGILEIYKLAHEINQNMVFAICGDGEERSKVDSIIKEQKMSYVKCPGLITNPESYLQNSVCFLLDSIYEANPMSIWEAMSCGCIPVIPNLPGMREIVPPECGYLFNAKEPLQASKIIANISSDPLSYVKMSETCIKWAKQNSIETVATNYIKVFGEICDD